MVKPSHLPHLANWGFRLKQSTHKVKIRVSGRKRTLKNFLGNVFSADADANSYDKLFALFLAHKPVVLKFGVVGNPGVNEMPTAGWTLAEGAYTGSAVITSLEANAPDGDKATLSISFEGTGSLAKEAASK